MSDNNKDLKESQERKFTGVWIPREVWEAQDIPPLAKFLLAEIHALQGTEGCFASNEYFMKMLQIGKRCIQKYLKVLKEKGYIHMKSFDGRRRCLATHVSFNQLTEDETYVI